MSLNHPGSIYLEKLSFGSLHYLVEPETLSGSIPNFSSDYFDVSTGKPFTNININTNIDNFFMQTLSDNLFESTNINNKLIYNHPKLLELDVARDMKVGGESTIDIVFLHEGASMQNSFGYYFYDIDSEGNKRFLGNDSDTQGYYYAPTVVFPHIYSDPDIPATLQRGETRRLRGNLPNGNFENVYIGLFLVPHGWFALKNDSQIYDHNILHSTIEFNNEYIKSEHQTIIDKIYSIYFKAVNQSGHELLLAGFEDIVINNSSDLDYNDCVVGFEISDVSNIENWDTYDKVLIKTDTSTPSNNIIFIDSKGEFLRLEGSKDVVPGKNYKFERHMYFSNETERDRTYEACRNVLTNYKYSIVKEDTIDKFKVVFTYLFRKNDLSQSQKKGDESSDEESDHNHNSRKEIYLLEAKHNGNSSNKNKMDTYKATLLENLRNLEYFEKYRLYQEDDSTKEVIKLSDRIDSPKRIALEDFRIMGNGVMDCINGKAHLPFQEKKIFQIYKNLNGSKGLTINVEMSDHPNGYMRDKKNFIRYISFDVDGTDKAIIDMATVDMCKIVSGSKVIDNTLIFDKISISEKIDGHRDIKELKPLFSSDPSTYYRILTINGTTQFYLVRTPKMKNIPIMVWLDTTYAIKWNESSNIQSGTYYFKQRLFEVSEL